jgi:hypothetical protein
LIDPENQSVDISMKLASSNSFQIRKYVSKHVQTPHPPSRNGNTIFSKKAIADDAITCPMGKYSKFAFN